MNWIYIVVSLIVCPTLVYLIGNIIWEFVKPHIREKKLWFRTISLFATIIVSALFSWNIYEFFQIKNGQLSIADVIIISSAVCSFLILITLFFLLLGAEYVFNILVKAVIELASKSEQMKKEIQELQRKVNKKGKSD
jgi:hypothetical protein